MPFDVDIDKFCDIIPAFVNDWKARNLNVSDFAVDHDISFEHALTIIQMGEKMLREKNS